MQAGQVVLTETEVYGFCTVRVTQTVKDLDHTVRLMAQAAALTMRADASVSGHATVARFDPNGRLECTGVYVVELHPAGARPAQ